jgi:hypothetical protein
MFAFLLSSTQTALKEAMQRINQGLTVVNEGFESRIQEYDDLLSNRTMVCWLGSETRIYVHFFTLFLRLL